MKFSIITPMFNSYDLMNNYFDSLENQTYKNFELIIIDDCSIDDSYDKLESYANDSSLNIKILRTPKNLGPGYARNMGIDIASGEWITFTDNDDWVDYDWLGYINNIISRTDADCIIHDYYMKGKECNRVMDSIPGVEEGIVNKNQCLTFIRNHTVAKFYKLTNLVKNKIRFPHIRRCEDVAFTNLAISNYDKIYYLKKPFYHYIQRESSLSKKNSLDEKDMVAAFTILQEKLEDEFPKEIAEKSIGTLLYGGILIMCKAGKSKKDIRKYIEQYEEKYPEWYSSESILYFPLQKKIFLKFIRYRILSGLKILTWIHNKLVIM